VSRLALYLIGSPRIELGGEEIHIGRRKALALLAYVAVTRERHQRDALATLLWPEYDQSRARADLRRTLSLLNRALGEEWLSADRETAGLRQTPSAGSALRPERSERTGQSPPESSGPDLWLDVAQFRQDLAACETHGHAAGQACAESVPLLEEAVGLYGDDFLAGFTLRDSLAGALECLVRWRDRRREYEPALAQVRRCTVLDPLHEPARRCPMLLYA
jgi:hypothetical protein